MRQIVTRGTVDLFDPPDPTVLVQVGEQGFWYADLYDTGLHGVISKTRAYSPQALDPKIKHYSRMNFVLAHQEAHDVDPGRLADPVGRPRLPRRGQRPERLRRHRRRHPHPHRLRRPAGESRAGWPST